MVLLEFNEKALYTWNGVSIQYLLDIIIIVVYYCGHVIKYWVSESVTKLAIMF